MTQKKILIVEDDRVVARDIAQQLTREGYLVVAAVSTGEDALRLAVSETPDLVLMDLRLEGEMDGIEVANQMRASLAIPVVFLTAYADHDTVQRAAITEPFGYLIKPFEDSQLRTVVEMALYKYAAERRLRQSESRFAATLSSIGDAVIATDGESHITFLNRAAEVMTGWPRDEAMGRALADVFHLIDEETRMPVPCPALGLLQSAAVASIGDGTVLVSRDGREFPIDNRGSPIIDDKGQPGGAVLVFRDVTRKRAVEGALRSAQAELERVSRLMTMAELTASIAHEIIQPLTGIINYASAGLNFLAHDQVDLAELRDVLGNVLKDGRRAAEVVRSLRALARKSRPEVTSYDMNEMIREVVALTNADIQRHGVRLSLNLCPAPCWVLADLIQMRQVLLNLIKNGIEAMRATAVGQRQMILSSENLPDGFVRVTVRDSGPGFAAEDLDRVFEPFFTTKDTGMGMGLSICKTIVEAHAGRLWAESASPGGALVGFELAANP
jgi:PAS domain S-box-containing protein